MARATAATLREIMVEFEFVKCAIFFLRVVLSRAGMQVTRD
jgi:hypothetical protein